MEGKLLAFSYNELRAQRKCRPLEQMTINDEKSYCDFFNDARSANDSEGFNRANDRVSRYFFRSENIESVRERLCP